MRYDRNHGKIWTSEDIKKLRSLIKEGTPIEVMQWKLGRTKGSVRDRINKIKGIW